MVRRPNRMDRYTGIAVGGPKKGLRIEFSEPVYELARMKRMPEGPEGDDDCLPFVEAGRGEYHFESGHWWWQGWDR